MQPHPVELPQDVAFGVVLRLSIVPLVELYQVHPPAGTDSTDGQPDATGGFALSVTVIDMNLVNPVFGPRRWNDARPD